MALDYKKAGVDIQAGDQLVGWLQKKSVGSQQKSRVIGGIGGFAGLFKASFPKYKNPCLVASTDGVGTKVLIASQFKSYEGVGQDLVAMCVNDLVCTGAEPLFFLDYYATGKLNLKAAKEFLTGVKKACYESGCALLGGETAEMPGVYKPEHFDCAGFAVGVVDRKKTLGPHNVKVGDRLVAVQSSGFHSNGYSLLRKVFARDIKKWSSHLLTPTDLYPELVKKTARLDIKAIANITGGGLDNIPRVLKPNQVASLEGWAIPEAFWEVKKRSHMSWNELLITLNCGLGLVFIVSSQDEKKLIKVIEAAGKKAIKLGKVTRKKNKTDKAWELEESSLFRG